MTQENPLVTELLEENKTLKSTIESLRNGHAYQLLMDRHLERCAAHKKLKDEFLALETEVFRIASAIRKT